MIKIILFIALAALLLLPILIAVSSAMLYGLWRAVTFENRFRKFFIKYDNEEVGRMIASGKIWTGQTADQLRDAKGNPARIDNAGDAEIWIYEGSMLAPAGMRIVINQGRVQTWS